MDWKSSKTLRKKIKIGDSNLAKLRISLLQGAMETGTSPCDYHLPDQQKPSGYLHQRR